METTTERWVPCPGYPDYEVSDGGRVRRVGPRKGAVVGAVLVGRLAKHGYLQVGLYEGRRRLNRYIHQLIWEAFVGPIPPGLEMHHRNADKTDNRLCNLETITHTANMAHAYREGLYRGKYGRPLLTEQQVRDIRWGYWSQLRAKEVAALLGMHPTAIWNIRAGRTWRLVTAA